MENFISVITTVKNSSKYIIEMLESVKSQSHNNFEHLIVDDGSTDDTVNKLYDFQIRNTDYPLKIFQPGNIGRGRALNYAVSKARANWIAIIDSDDLWHPEKLTIQSAIVQNNNVDALFTDTQLFSSKSEIIIHEASTLNTLAIIKLHNLLKHNRLSHSSVLIRKQLCCYDESRHSQFDYELWLRLASQNRIIAKTNTKLDFHRIHKDQSFENTSGKKYYWRSFKLKSKYTLSERRIIILMYNTFKLFYDLFLPRNIRLTVRKLLNPTN